MEEKKYKNKVAFMYKSKGGEHLYAFSDDMGADVKSILVNISELIPVIEGKKDWCKVSLMPPEEND